MAVLIYWWNIVNQFMMPCITQLYEKLTVQLSISFTFWKCVIVTDHLTTNDWYATLVTLHFGIWPSIVSLKQNLVGVPSCSLPFTTLSTHPFPSNPRMQYLLTSSNSHPPHPPVLWGPPFSHLHLCDVWHPSPFHLYGWDGEWPKPLSFCQSFQLCSRIFRKKWRLGSVMIMSKGADLGFVFGFLLDISADWWFFIFLFAWNLVFKTH